MSSSDRRPPYAPTRVELAKNISLSLSLSAVSKLSKIALKKGLVSSLHFGAIPGRSAVDAAATLTHDVEKSVWK